MDLHDPSRGDNHCLEEHWSLDATRDIAWLRFLARFIVLWLALYGLGRIVGTSIDQGVVAATVVLALAVVVEFRVLKTPRAQVRAGLGSGDPTPGQSLACTYA